MILNLDSQVDIITNSSSTIFVTHDGIENVKIAIKEILKCAGINQDFDSLVSMKEYIPSETFDYILECYAEKKEKNITEQDIQPMKMNEDIEQYIEKQKQFLESKKLTIDDFMYGFDSELTYSIYVKFLNTGLGFDMLDVFAKIFTNEW